MAILEFRRRKGFTQQQLGELAGVSASMVAQWESGKKDPSFESLKQLLQLGMTTEELFGVPCNCAKGEATASTQPLTRDDVAAMIADALEQAKDKHANAG